MDRSLSFQTWVSQVNICFIIPWAAAGPRWGSRPCQQILCTVWTTCWASSSDSPRSRTPCSVWRPRPRWCCRTGASSPSAPAPACTPGMLGCCQQWRGILDHPSASQQCSWATHPDTPCHLHWWTLCSSDPDTWTGSSASQSRKIEFLKAKETDGRRFSAKNFMI